MQFAIIGFVGDLCSPFALLRLRKRLRDGISRSSFFRGLIAMINALNRISGGTAHSNTSAGSSSSNSPPMMPPTNPMQA